MLESEKVYTDTSEKCLFYNPQSAQQKTDFEIKLCRRVKKADPQAVQRGRLFRAALFAVFLVGLVVTACACIGERSEPTCIIQAHAVVPLPIF